MLKFIQSQLDVNLIKASLIFAFIYCLLFNTSIVIYKFGYYQVTLVEALLEFAKQFLYTYITLFIFFFGLTIHRLIFIFGTIFLFITGALASYYLFFFGVIPSAKLMPAIFGTNYNEVIEIISPRVIVWVIFSISICVYCIKYFKIHTTKIFVTKILSAICLLLAINNIIFPSFKNLKTYFPLQYLHGAYIYFLEQPDKITQ